MRAAFQKKSGFTTISGKTSKSVLTCTWLTTEGKQFSHAHAVTSVNTSWKAEFVHGWGSFRSAGPVTMGHCWPFTPQRSLHSISQSCLLHFFLCLLLQGSDLGSGFTFAGVSVVCWQELKALSVTDGLPEGALLIQQLLKGFILPQFIVLNHLEKHHSVRWAVVVLTEFS